MRWYSRVAIGIFFLVVLLEAFQGLGVGSPSIYDHVVHLLLVPVVYAGVAWLVMRGLAFVFKSRVSR